MIERCQRPGLRQLFRVDEGSSAPVRYRLRSAGRRACRARDGTILTDRHRNERRRWKLQRWHGVSFSDESRFHLKNPDGRLRVWHRRGTFYYNDCLV